MPVNTLGYSTYSVCEGSTAFSLLEGSPETSAVVGGSIGFFRSLTHHIDSLTTDDHFGLLQRPKFKVDSGFVSFHPSPVSVPDYGVVCRCVHADWLEDELKWNLDQEIRRAEAILSWAEKSATEAAGEYRSAIRQLCHTVAQERVRDHFHGGQVSGELVGFVIRELAMARLAYVNSTTSFAEWLELTDILGLEDGRTVPERFILPPKEEDNDLPEFQWDESTFRTALTIEEYVGK